MSEATVVWPLDQFLLARGPESGLEPIAPRAAAKLAGLLRPRRVANALAQQPGLARQQLLGTALASDTQPCGDEHDEPPGQREANEDHLTHFTGRRAEPGDAQVPQKEPRHGEGQTQR